MPADTPARCEPAEDAREIVRRLRRPINTIHLCETAVKAAVLIERKVAEIDWLRVVVDGTTWDDKPLPEDDEIMAAHPGNRTASDVTYAEAMRLVGARRSKVSLCNLVNWLLAKIAATADREKALVEALKDARKFIAAELDVRLDSFCLKGTDGKPDISTLDDSDGGTCGEAMDFLARIDAALAKVKGPQA